MVIQKKKNVYKKMKFKKYYNKIERWKKQKVKATIRKWKGKKEYIKNTTSFQVATC